MMPPSSRRPARSWVIAWAVCGVAVAAYLAADRFYAFRHPSRIQVEVPREDGRFLLRSSDFLSFSAIKQARLHIRVEQRLSGAAFFTLDPATGRLRTADLGVRRLSDRRFVLPVDDDLLEWVIEFFPRDPVPDRLSILAILRSEARWTVVPLQWAAGVLILMFVVSSVAAAWRIVRPGESGPAIQVRRAVLAFLGLCLTFLAYAALHAGGYLRIFQALGVRAVTIAVLNLAGAAVLVGLALLFQKTKAALVGLPVLFAVVFAAAGWSYRLPICGDADQWIHQLMDGRANPVAELLGFTLARGLFRGLRSIQPASSPLTVLSLLGKAAGVLYFFALYRIAATLCGASRDRAIVFFLAAAALPVTVFFFGYPEFAYLPLPFLLLAVLAAERYLRAEDGLPAMAGAAAGIALAALFHAGQLVCVPALLLLPFLKSGRRPFGRPLPPGRIVRDSLGGLAVVAALTGAALWAHRRAGVPLLWDNVQGGGDGDRLVEFFQTARVIGAGAILLEIRYLWLGGWTVLAGVPLALLALAGRLKTWAARDGFDLVLFLFGAPSVLLFLFWNHDLGFRDLDLLIAPLTLLQILCLKAIVETGAGRAGRGRLLLAALGASSGFFLILALTTGG